MFIIKIDKLLIFKACIFALKGINKNFFTLNALGCEKNQSFAEIKSIGVKNV